MGIFRFGKADYSLNFFIGAILMVLSGLCCLTAFASPYWTKRYEDTPKDFRSIGLWELCLYKYRHYKDDLQIPYTGCFWFWTNEMYRFRDWIIPRMSKNLTYRLLQILLCSSVVQMGASVRNTRFHLYRRIGVDSSGCCFFDVPLAVALPIILLHHGFGHLYVSISHPVSLSTYAFVSCF